MTMSSQSYGFSSSHAWMWELDHKESWAPTLRTLLRVPWTARRSNQSILKEISPGISLLLSSSPPACSLSQHQGLFQWVSSSQQVAKVLELQHQYFQWIFRIISLRIDWCDLLTVQGTLKFSTAPQFWRHQFFFIVRLSHSYMAAGKTIALTRWTFVSTVKIPYYEAHLFTPLMVVLLKNFHFKEV